MRPMPSMHPPINANPAANWKSWPWTEVIAGYSAATLGLVALLTVNGGSGNPTAVVIGTALLIAVGLLLPAAGMLQLTRAVDHGRKAGRYGLAMQALGLIGLLLGVLPLAASASVLALFVVSGILILMSAALAVTGAFLLRSHYADIGASDSRGVAYLIVGTVLIFSGVLVILGSNVASNFFFLSNVRNTVYTDVGAAVSACGCVLAAYSFFVLQRRRFLRIS